MKVAANGDKSSLLVSFLVYFVFFVILNIHVSLLCFPVPLGKLEGRKGYFVGIQLDMPVGKNDGSLQGTRYFTCLEKYGLFTAPEHVCESHQLTYSPISL